MKSRGVVLAFPLLATVSALVYATVSYAAAERASFMVGLVILTLAGVIGSLLGWQLLRRIDALRGALEAEHEKYERFAAHSREMYSELERKLESRTAELTRQRDILVRTEKLTSLSRLVGGVAHELNNPLMAVLGEATLLRERTEVPELRRGLKVIEQQALRCANLVRDLTAFATQQQRQVQPLDVHALIEGALSQAATVAPGQEVKVVREYHQEPLIVVGNMEQLQQAITNVITNAFQAMPNGEVNQLTLRTKRPEAGWVRLEVEDSGAGIGPEVLSYLFDPFYTRPQAKLGMSLGMGLSVALSLVQAHGGRIWADSQVGKGTTVFIELPETRQPAPERDRTADGGR